MRQGNDQLPLVSIIITSYNRADRIEKAIDSALAQDYSNIEVVITDNCSTDNTDQVITRYLGDSRIKYSKNATNIGMIANFKKATNELATGEYVVYISSDDYLYDPTFISASITLIEKNKGVRMVFGKLATFEQFIGGPLKFRDSDLWTKEVWDGFDVFLRFPANGFLCFGGCLFRREDLVNLRIFDMGHVNCDVECILKITMLGKVGFVNKDAYVFVRHDGNQSGQMTETVHLAKLGYVEEVYNWSLPRLAKEHHPALEHWKKTMLNMTIKSSLYFLKVHNEPEFKKFVPYVVKNYPEYLKDLRKDLVWYTKIKMNRQTLLLLYKIFKPKYYRQEFAALKK